jgi:hypothetical protein
VSSPTVAWQRVGKSPLIATQWLGKNPPIVARQWLGKNAIIVAKQWLSKNPPIVARQRLGKFPLSLLGNGLLETLPW